MKKVEKNWKTFFGLELLYSSRQAFWCIESGGTEFFFHNSCMKGLNSYKLRNNNMLLLLLENYLILQILLPGSDNYDSTTNKKPKRLENSQLLRKIWHVNHIFELIL